MAGAYLDICHFTDISLHAYFCTKTRRKGKCKLNYLVFLSLFFCANLVAESVDSRTLWMIWADTG